MSGIMLTSTGLENPIIEKEFLKMIGKNAIAASALWIPTAATTEEAKAVLPKCMNDLLHAGIQRENIYTYDLDYVMVYEELKKFDVVYVCGGDSTYLLEQMIKADFIAPITKYATSDGVYIGVSAGSIVCSRNFEKAIPFLPCKLDVHCDTGHCAGSYDFAKEECIRLTNSSAIVLTASEQKIIV
ncbi:MAG: Type 1 glutamine amidotransferase-like domain-containing protein [Lachnospiraceae bacterium]|nr:Type 1 glutamine amidotransferase-like domain-containing protein [Lachnospiraceae bacterium]